MSSTDPLRGQDEPPLKSTPGVDLDAVANWLQRNAPAVAPRAPLRAEMLSGGLSNLTYGLTDGSVRLVLRRPPLGDLLPTAHDMGREFRVMAALAETKVPVPRMYGLCTDNGVIGAPFLVMEWVQGLVRRDVGDFADMTPQLARGSAEQLIEVLSDLHSIDVREVGLESHGRPAGYLVRQLRRWRAQLTASKTRELPELDELSQRLEKLTPTQSDGTIVHGDYRYDNVIFAERTSARIAALVDWELSTVGDPLADVGFLLMSWDDKHGPVLEGGVTSNAVGFPTREELAGLYARRSGRAVDNLDFHIGLAFFKAAVIFEGIHGRHLAGDTVGDGFDGIGDRVLQFAARGLEITSHQAKGATL